MQSVDRKSILRKKQQRTRYMLEHIIARLPSRLANVEAWLALPQNGSIPQFHEWGASSQWLEKLCWMRDHLTQEWDEVERLMTNHPFSCIIDENERERILRENPVYSASFSERYRKFDLADLA